MHPEKNHPNLHGRSIFLVEAEQLLGEMTAICYVGEGFSKVELDTVVPDNLLEIMDKKGIESAIIHPSNSIEEASILKAHEAGKKIVVIKRRVPIIAEDIPMYDRLGEAGVPLIDKSTNFESYFGDSLSRLSRLFEE